jgi:hypothetical protein
MMEEETTKKVNNLTGTNITEIAGLRGGSIVEGFRKDHTNILARCHANSPG